MELLNWCKKHRNKPIQLTIASIIISHTHAPLQLCIVTPNCITIVIVITTILWSDNTELQWCMGVAHNYTCYRQLYGLVPVLFTPVQQLHPTCFCTFTPVQLCTFLIFKEILYVQFHSFFIDSRTNFALYNIIVYSYYPQCCLFSAHMV